MNADTEKSAFIQNELTGLIADMLQPPLKQDLQPSHIVDIFHLHPDALPSHTLGAAQPQMKYNSQCLHLFTCQAMPKSAVHL